MKLLILLLATLTAFPAFADEFIQWHSTNLQLLRGFDYKLGNENRTIVTFEHANGWRYGDFHAFTDVIWADGDATLYSEVAPRFSFSKISGYDFSYGIIKDISLSTQIEKPEHQAVRYLYGLGVDLNIEGFKYFKTNWLLRDNQRLNGTTYQLTLAWNRPFTLAGTQWVIEGFADFAGAEGATTSHQLIVPRFLLDIGDLTGHEAGNLYAGIEWSYWHNKFGVDGVTESVPQLQVKWQF